jgi:predicted metal-dependent enzyme (double-stranded beta helix superfamily)
MGGKLNIEEKFYRRIRQGLEMGSIQVSMGKIRQVNNTFRRRRPGTVYGLRGQLRA